MVALPFEKGQNWVMYAPCRPAGNYRGRGSWTLRIGDGLSERDGNIQDGKQAGLGRRTMMKTRTLVIVLFASGASSIALAQQTAQLQFSRVVDLTIPIESNMPGIPGIKIYDDNPSKVDVVAAITDAQKEQLRAESMTLNSNIAVNGRSMISVLSILVHNGTHRDGPRHNLEEGSPIQQMPYLEAGVGALMASKGVPAVALDVFPEKPLWRGVKLDPGEVWVANHLALFEKGIPLIQFVTNLSQIGTNKFLLVALPLKIKGGDASPARVVALVE